jgi:CRISPR system Cascade subunit CasD
VAVVEGDRELLSGLAEAVMHPAFPLALGRRSCVPCQPLLLCPGRRSEPLWAGPLEDTLGSVPWQVSPAHRQRVHQPTVPLAVTFDDDNGRDSRADVPVTFAHRYRAFTSRQVTQAWMSVPTGASPDDTGTGTTAHDPFALLGW